ncbi:Homoserine dehydrogenase [Methanimicrococcus sp. At1]|uniref:Homoserine dehydrogenase n=1 Tax=Methanimicrococcus hacksteinii TaxID=3028293 RepID=A0ABU3VQH2_9EURY|nr:homoserine dehydrogenase [Methanimicrococcus sp. At1]MDV0445665.1 Homoserine dehydrogenase [Methanimicrococcus sp. At1]
MKTVKASIIGFGSIGQGVARVLLMKKDYLNNAGIDLKVVAITDSKGAVVDENGLDLEKCLAVKSEKKTIAEKEMTGLDVIEQIDHDLVIEVTPTDVVTGGAGLLNMEAAFEKGMDVVTSNKGPLTLKFKELNELADKNGCAFRYEATVGGAMPIINLTKEVMAGNEIESIKGIFNGTCNYILTRMLEEKSAYSEILTEAVDLGIAETDPTYDVEGIDTAGKVVILANTVFGMNKTINDVDRTGITQMTYEALEMSTKNGKAIKLIGEVKKDGSLTVSPRLVPIGHPLSVSGTLNVATIQTDLAGEITVTGKGAGSVETASAILSDIISIYKED